MSIELLKSISTQKVHKTCNKQGSILHYLGTNHVDITPPSRSNRSFSIVMCGLGNWVDNWIL